MSDLYNAAADEFPRMRQEARQRRARLADQEAGIQSLFDDEVELPTPPRTSRAAVRSPRAVGAVRRHRSVSATRRSDGTQTEWTAHQPTFPLVGGPSDQMS